MIAFVIQVKSYPSSQMEAIIIVEAEKMYTFQVDILQTILIFIYCVTLKNDILSYWECMNMHFYLKVYKQRFENLNFTKKPTGN